MTTTLEAQHPVEAAHSDTAAPDATLRVGAREIWTMVAVTLLAATLLIGLHVRAYIPLSPIDELQHFDYMLKASHGHVVRPGEVVGETALRSEACRKVDAPGFEPPPCDAPQLSPAAFQEYGYNTAATQTPIYYALSGIGARMMVAAGVVEDPFVAGRLMGAVWLTLGLALTWVLLRWLGTDRTASAVVLCLLGTTPVVVHASATINPDGALLAVGAAMGLTVIAFERGRIPAAAPAAAAFIAVTVEPTAMIVVGACALYVASMAAAGDSMRRSLGVAGMTVIAAVLAIAIGIGYRAAIALPTANATLPRDAQFEVDNLPSDQLAASIASLTTPVQNPYVPPPLRMVATSTAITVSNWLALGSVVGGALLLVGAPRLRRLAVVTLVTMIGAGPALVLYNYLLSGVFFAIPARYGLSLLPLIAVAVGRALAGLAARLICSAALALYVVLVLSRLATW